MIKEQSKTIKKNNRYYSELLAILHITESLISTIRNGHDIVSIIRDKDRYIITYYGKISSDNKSKENFTEIYHIPSI